MLENRLNEAEECIKKAEKYLKTSLTKWKPDYDSAASEYDRAAICLKNAKKLDEALSTFLKSSDCYEKIGNMFHAAKGKEQAALIAKETNMIDKAKELMQQAAQMYAESGTVETSAMALEKTGKFFESVDMQKAIEIYEKALTLVPDTDRSRLSGEFLRRITYMYLKQENYAKACENIRREIELYRMVDEPAKIGKLTASLVLVDLAKEDAIEAEKDLAASYRIRGFVDTADATILQPLIDSYRSADEKTFQNILNHPHMKSNDNEFLRLMKKLKVPSVDAAQAGNTGADVKDEDYSALL